MATEKSSGPAFLDAHVHLWDRGNHGKWYHQPSASGGPDFGLGDVSPLANDYLLADYMSDAAGRVIAGLVHVSAVADHFEDETAWVTDLWKTNGFPNAVIGSVHIDAPWGSVEESLLSQSESPLFRGLRVLHGLEAGIGNHDACLSLSTEQGWVYDAVAHTSTLGSVARIADRYPELAIVLEHAGWPLEQGADELDRWRRGMADVAAHENVNCKISGLAMTLHSLHAGALRPWVLHCLEEFGPQRCVFASNFPVDRLYGGYGDLMSCYADLTEHLSDEDRDRVFVENARAIYRPIS